MRIASLTLTTYSEYGRDIGQALNEFESSHLSDTTDVYTLSCKSIWTGKALCQKYKG